MNFSIVVAVDRKLGIGKDNSLPWRLPGDLKYFKELTSKAAEGKRNVVIMGRKTWESIPEKFRPLPNRLNIVLSRDSVHKIEYRLPEGTYLFASLEEALKSCDNSLSDLDQVFVIGGAQLYSEALNSPQLKRLYVTEIDHEFDCDRFFPDYKSKYKLLSTSDLQQDNGIEYSFKVYEPA